MTAQLKLTITDLGDSRHARAWLALLEHYARDPMGGGVGLSTFARRHLVERLRLRPDFVGLNVCFCRKRSFLKTTPSSAMRTEPPDACAAKIALIARRCHRIARGNAAGFTESRRTNHTNRPRSNPDIRCAPVLRLTCGLSCRQTCPAQRQLCRLEDSVGAIKAL